MCVNYNRRGDECLFYLHRFFIFSLFFNNMLQFSNLLFSIQQFCRNFFLYSVRSFLLKHKVNLYTE